MLREDVYQVDEILKRDEHASIGYEPPIPEVFVPAFAAGCATPSGSAAARFLTASRDDDADAELREVLTERRTKFFCRHGVTALAREVVVPRRQFSGRNVNKRAIPILTVNQFHASATNE